MHLESLYVKNFRNFKELGLDLKPGLNLILGDNSTGKTNLVEMIYFLSTFGSFRTSKDREMLKFGESFFIVSGVYEGREYRVRYSDKKEVFIEGVKQKSMKDSFGGIPVIAIVSDDIEIINGPPGRRRYFMNFGISLYKKAYIDVLSQYNRAWKQRNNLLKYAKGGKAVKSIDVWEKQLALKAEPIVSERKQYIKKLIEYASPVFKELSGNKLEISYREGGDYTDLLSQLRRMRTKEIERGYSLYGPHRDNILFKVDGHTARASASFGIKRLLTVTLRIAQGKILSEIRGEEPIFILDEVIGELDNRRIKLLIDILKGYNQVIVATARSNIFDVEDFNIYKIEDFNGTPIVKRCFKEAYRN